MMAKSFAALLLMALMVTGIRQLKFGNTKYAHKRDSSWNTERMKFKYNPYPRTRWIPAKSSQPNFSTCPRLCQCVNTSSGLTTDCSSRKLVKIPGDLPEATVILHLSYNNITYIDGRAFEKLDRVLHIDLANNSIERLETNSFSGLKNLKFLSLAFNKLKYTDSFPVDVFIPLSSIQELHLHGNCDEDSLQNCAYLGNAIHGVKSLEILLIDGIPLGPGFKQLVNLSKLIMSNGYCVLKDINIGTFMALSNAPLEYLNLQSCNIQYVEPNTFSCLKHLEVLIMSDNYQLCKEGLNNLTIGIDHTSIRKLVLQQTCNDDITFLQLRNDVFLSLMNTSLLHLDITHCHIDYISAEVVQHFPDTLRYLILKDNDIHENSLRLIMFILRLKQLEYFDGSMQLRYVDINSETHVDTDIKSVEESSQISASQTKQRANIHSDVLRWPINPVPIPPKLKFLNVSFVKVEKYEIPAVNFSTNNTLEVLDISNNVFQKIGRINGLRFLIVLNMSNNQIEYIHHEAFGDMEMLKMLNLSENRLGKNIMNVDSENIFTCQKTLEKLYMSSNMIKALPRDIFSSLTNLRELYLDDNALVSISFELGNLINLEILDLSGNSLKDISIATQNQLNSISLHHNFAIDIDSNLLACTCDQKAFVKWLSVTTVNITGKGQLSCMLSNKTSALLSRLPDIEEQISFECNIVAVLTGCIVTFFGLLILLKFVLALFSQRSKLKYLYFLSKKNINPYHPIQKDTVLLQLDAYISFDEDYVFPNTKRLYDFVTRDVYDGLKARGLTIKIRQELMGGQLLHDVISSAIRQSRKVVVFLTSDYCNDFWNTFEFNFAAYEGIYTKRNVIIPVAVGPLCPNDLLPEIIAYLKNDRLIVCPMDVPLAAFLDVLELKIRNV